MCVPCRILEKKNKRGGGSREKLPRVFIYRLHLVAVLQFVGRLYFSRSQETVTNGRLFFHGTMSLGFISFSLKALLYLLRSRHFLGWRPQQVYLLTTPDSPVDVVSEDGGGGVKGKRPLLLCLRLGMKTQLERTMKTILRKVVPCL